MLSEKAVKEMYDLAVQRAARWEICAGDFEMRDKAAYYHDEYAKELSRLRILGEILEAEDTSADIREEKRRLERSGEAKEVLAFERRGGAVGAFKRLANGEED